MCRFRLIRVAETKKIYYHKKGNEGENMFKGLPNLKINPNKNVIQKNIQKKTETKIYHSPQDTVRKKLMVDLNKLEIDRKSDIKTNTKIDNFNRDFNGNDNGNDFNNNLILDGYNYSYKKLSYLYRNGKLTKDQLLDLKAQKQGFKNHYDRVLMRYMEVVKNYKVKNLDGSFKDAKEKHRLFKQMKSMESFLRQKEIEKEAGLNRLNELNRSNELNCIQHVPMSTMKGCCYYC
ncbi:MAG: hypothetical protein LAN71_17270 [Acidobacteriia bacterium]|nr:hypothetical protein [Terriglobia bacterium]